MMILALGLMFAASTAAQDKADLAVIWKIKDEAINRSQVMQTLSYLTDVIGPRLTGSPAMKEANDWTQKKLAEWGLENAHLESYPFGRGWSLERFSAHMISPHYYPLIAFPKSWIPGTAGSVTAEVKRVDIRTEADIEKYKGQLKGLFVLSEPPREVEAVFNPLGRRYTDDELQNLAKAPDPTERSGFRPGQRPGQMNSQLQRRVREFYVSEGVAAVIDPSRGDGGTVFVGSGGERQKDGPAVPTQVVMAIEHYNRICRILEKGDKVQLEMDIQAKFQDTDLNAYNTIAEIPGTDKKDEVVMIGGHLDSYHCSTGATDNASGSAVAMEAMRILKAIGVKMRRTVRIGLWSGEEQGFVGSRAYVSDHFASRPEGSGGRGGRGEGGPPPGMGFGAPQGPLNIKAEYTKFSAYFNYDNGTGKIRGIYLQGNEELRPIFTAWLAPFADMGASAVTIRNTGGTDHIPFDSVGLPGFQFIQDPIEYNTRTHHSTMDVYDRIQRADIIQSAIIMASFAYHTAMREEKLPRKPLPKGAEPARTP
jgi:hypothetical protein